MHGVYGLLLSLEGPFAWCSAEKWRNISVSGKTDLTAKQGGTSNQQLQNSYFWAVLVLGLPNAKGQLLGTLVKANHQNRRAEPGKRAIPCQCLPHEQIQTFVGRREKGLVSPVPRRAFPILINTLDYMLEWALDAPSPSAEPQGTGSAKCIPTHCAVSQATAPSEMTTAAASPSPVHFQGTFGTC